MLHIGLTGTNASGKTFIVNYLASKGFKNYSLSDIIRDELARQKLPASREKMIRMGNQLRGQFGADVLAKRTITKIKTQRTVIDSVRNAKEVAMLRTVPGFYLLAIDAPVENRFARAQKRGRLENAQTLGDFIRLEELEKSKEKTHQNLDQCMALADYHIYNDADFDQFKQEIDDVLEVLFKISAVK